MHDAGIALFGDYNSAMEMAEFLRSGQHRVVVVDDDRENLEKARRAGFQTAEVDYRDDAELEKLGLGSEIGTLFSLFPSDAENVFLTISARALAPDIRIITIAHGSDAAPNLRAAGADKVIETHAISSNRIWDIMHRPAVTAILDRTLFGQADLNIAEVPLSKASFLDGVAVGDAGLERRYDLILTGLVDAQHNEHFIFGKGVPEMPLQAGCILLVIGSAEAIGALQNDLEPTSAS